MKLDRIMAKVEKLTQEDMRRISKKAKKVFVKKSRSQNLSYGISEYEQHQQDILDDYYDSIMC